MLVMEPVHIAGVNNVSGLLDDFAVVFFDSVTFNKAGNFDQQLLIPKREVEIVISARMQSKQTVVIGSSDAADQQDRNICRSLVVLQIAGRVPSRPTTGMTTSLITTSGSKDAAISRASEPFLAPETS